MDIVVTNKPDQAHEETISSGLKAYNRVYSSGTSELLSVYARDAEGILVGGLVGVTYGGWLHVSDLWVRENCRGESLGSQILAAAEKAAANRGCVGSTLDTYSFQALGFYLKQGYIQFGTLAQYAGKYERHYLQKHLVS